MHDPWEPSFLQPTASPLSRKNSLDNLCMLSSSKTRKSTSLRRGKSPKRRNFLMDREQEDCQSSVALLDSFESTLETSASQCSTSMQTIFSALQTELTQSNITSRLKQLPPSTCCSNKKVSVNSVKDISALLGDAKDLRFFEEMTDLLEGLQDTSLCLISLFEIIEKCKSDYFRIKLRENGFLQRITRILFKDFNMNSWSPEIIVSPNSFSFFTNFLVNGQDLSFLFLEPQFLQLLAFYSNVEHDYLQSENLILMIINQQYPIKVQQQTYKGNLFTEKKQVLELSRLLKGVQWEHTVSLTLFHNLLVGEFCRTKNKLGPSLCVSIEKKITKEIRDCEVTFKVITEMKSPRLVTLSLQYLEFLTTLDSIELLAYRDAKNMEIIFKLAVDSEVTDIQEASLRLLVNMTNNRQVCEAFLLDEALLQRYFSDLFSDLIGLEKKILLLGVLSNIVENIPQAVMQIYDMSSQINGLFLGSSLNTCRKQGGLIRLAVKYYLFLLRQSELSLTEKPEHCEKSNSSEFDFSYQVHLILPYYSLFLAYCMLGEGKMKKYFEDLLEGYSTGTIEAWIEELVKWHSMTEEISIENCENEHNEDIENHPCDDETKPVDQRDKEHLPVRKGESMRRTLEKVLLQLRDI